MGAYLALNVTIRRFIRKALSGDCVSIFSSFVDFGVGGVEWGGRERGVRQRDTY
jgi:hypothetical protein